MIKRGFSFEESGKESYGKLLLSNKLFGGKRKFICSFRAADSRESKEWQGIEIMIPESYTLQILSFIPFLPSAD